MNSDYVFELTIPWIGGIYFQSWSIFVAWLGLVLLHVPSVLIGLCLPFYSGWKVYKEKKMEYLLTFLFLPGILLLFCFPFISLLVSIPLLLSFSEKNDKFDIWFGIFYTVCAVMFIWGMFTHFLIITFF